MTDIPIAPKELHHPSIIMVRWWPRVWTFTCGYPACGRDVSVFGWWGFATCPFCRSKHGMKWLFPGSGY